MFVYSTYTSFFILLYVSSFPSVLSVPSIPSVLSVLFFLFFLPVPSVLSV